LSILDTASPALSAIRAARRENIKALEELLVAVGEKIVSSGGMDSVVITTRRARQCIAVRASHKHLLRGGLVLDFSNSGATVFMEPKDALELNNNEVKLSAQEKAEELAILERLSEKLAIESEDIYNLLQKVTFLDLACAKAGHARWLHSIMPVFFPDSLSKIGKVYGAKSTDAKSDFSIDIEGLCHPLLLGPALVHNKNQGHANLPIPVDFKVKHGVRVIVISGPNTGGKTASMKTLGVAALMAKAGLFLPAKQKAILPWFDKVLADIGDSQVKRLRIARSFCVCKCTLSGRSEVQVYQFLLD
jgi:dsDNA-specific endonuclease/ATPase MutS2